MKNVAEFIKDLGLDDELRQAVSKIVEKEEGVAITELSALLKKKGYEVSEAQIKSSWSKIKTAVKASGALGKLKGLFGK